ncbi:hypothetical protein E3N88_20506 [Mikania micrantha]|uniref:Uncharacterized protein n=1 Tax=Mikania micrantha TaxID=192012 RepID=A0A5N6NJ20_9ASTR|nr:hypothetical protein E3N88_20506 [Mikania micrantha]
MFGPSPLSPSPETANDGNPIDKEEDSRSGPGFESNRPSLSSQGEARNSSKCSFFNLSAAQEVGLAAPPTRSGF